MKRAALFACLCFFLVRPLYAQEAEWNSYVGELHEFQFKYPNTWAREIFDTIKVLSLVNVFDTLGPVGVSVITSKCPGIDLVSHQTLSNHMISHKSDVKRYAKKKKDGYFKVLGDGELEMDGEKCKWIEYTLTQMLESGKVNKLTVRDYLFHHNPNSAGRDLFKLKFFSNTEDWSKHQETFAKIMSSFKFAER